MAVGNSLAKKAQVQQSSLTVYLAKDAVRNQINSVVGGKDGARFISSIVSAVQVNPALQECTNPSIVSAALLGESLNLSPSPQLGQYYMVPYDNSKKGVKEAQFQIGYKGYIQLAIRSGQYKKLNVLAIKEGELIRFDPLNEEIREANAFAPDVAVEVHTNIGGGSGFEVYRQTSTGFGEQSLRLAEEISDHVRLTYAPMRSPTIRTKLMVTGKDWFGWLRRVNCPAVLCEGFFVDSETDREFYNDRAALLNLGRAYAHGVLSYLGIKLNPDTGADVIYRVQTGAFAKKENAKAYAEMLEAAGYPTIIKEEKA